MNKGMLGSLADLAKILEEASDPTSAVREDRKEVKAKTATRKGDASRIAKVVDPKRKAWYERRLREQAAREAGQGSSASVAPEPVIQPEMTKAAVTKVGGSLLQALSAAKSATQAAGAAGSKRPEAWRRKPGDPIF